MSEGEKTVRKLPLKGKEGLLVNNVCEFSKIANFNVHFKYLKNGY
jgi:hypothetical protein